MTKHPANAEEECIGDSIILCAPLINIIKQGSPLRAVGLKNLKVRARPQPTQ